MLLVLWPSIITREPQWTDFITVRELFPPKTRMKYFPQFLKRGSEAVWNREGVSYQTGSGLLLLIAQVYPQCDSNDGDSTQKTHRHAQRSRPLWPHTQQGQKRRHGNGFMIFHKSFSCSRWPFPKPWVQSFLLSFFRVNVADNKPIELGWLIYFDKNSEIIETNKKFPGCYEHD